MTICWYCVAAIGLTFLIFGVESGLANKGDRKTALAWVPEAAEVPEPAFGPGTALARQPTSAPANARARARRTNILTTRISFPLLKSKPRERSATSEKQSFQARASFGEFGRCAPTTCSAASLVSNSAVAPRKIISKAIGAVPKVEGVRKVRSVRQYSILWWLGTDRFRKSAGPDATRAMRYATR